MGESYTLVAKVMPENCTASISSFLNFLRGMETLIDDFQIEEAAKLMAAMQE